MTRRSRAAALILVLALSALPSLAAAGERTAPLREVPGLLSALWDAALDLLGLGPDQDPGRDPQNRNNGDLGPGLDPAG